VRDADCGLVLPLPPRHVVFFWPALCGSLLLWSSTPSEFSLHSGSPPQRETVSLASSPRQSSLAHSSALSSSRPCCHQNSADSHRRRTSMLRTAALAVCRARPPVAALAAAPRFWADNRFRCMGIGSEASDNDPEVIEREKKKSLAGASGEMWSKGGSGLGLLGPQHLWGLAVDPAGASSVKNALACELRGLDYP
jgi:hypothetical protein